MNKVPKNILAKKNIFDIIKDVEIRMACKGGIPDNIKEKYYRGIMKLEKGDEDIREVVFFLMHNNKWEIKKGEKKVDY